MGLPKVLVFTPIYEAKDYCLFDFIESVKELTYPNFEHILIDNSVDKKYYLKLKKRYGSMNIHHVSRGNNSREALARSANFARKYAIENGYDYMLSLESDVFAPKEIIEGLMTWGKDVVTGLYFIGDRSKGVRVPCVTIAKWNDSLGAWGTRLLEPKEWNDYLKKGLKQVQAGGFGACLIHKNVFERFSFYYDPRFQGHPDIYFFNQLFEAKIPVFVDTDMVCDHMNTNWSDVKDR